MGALFKNIYTSIMTQIAIGNDIVLNCIAHAHALGGSPYPRFSSFILVTKNPLGSLFKKHIMTQMKSVGTFGYMFKKLTIF